MREVIVVKLTVRKAEGPGWLMIAEVVHEDKYKVYTERCGKEPQYDVILAFLHRLPRLWDKVAGVEAEETAEPKAISAKRAARLASREMEQARLHYSPSKSVRIKGEEMEKAHQIRRETIEVCLWVKPGKKRARLLEETTKGMQVMEVTCGLSESRAHAEIQYALKRRYGVYDRDIELIEGYASQRKRYRVTLR